MTENRYANSKVYKLVDDDGYYYYGSCSLQLHKRLYYHKMDSKKKSNIKIYRIFTHERFNNNEIKIILVEEFNLQKKKNYCVRKTDILNNTLMIHFV